MLIGVFAQSASLPEGGSDASDRSSGCLCRVCAVRLRGGRRGCGRYGAVISTTAEVTGDVIGAAARTVTGSGSKSDQDSK